MLKQTCPALALSFLVVLSPVTAMAYGGYIPPPTEEAKPAPPHQPPHHMKKHPRQKKMKHHQAVGETPKMEEMTY